MLSLRCGLRNKSDPNEQIIPHEAIPPVLGMSFLSSKTTPLPIKVDFCQQVFPARRAGTSERPTVPSRPLEEGSMC